MACWDDTSTWDKLENTHEFHRDEYPKHKYVLVWALHDDIEGLETGYDVENDYQEILKTIREMGALEGDDDYTPYFEYVLSKKVGDTYQVIDFESLSVHYNLNESEQ